MERSPGSQRPACHGNTAGRSTTRATSTCLLCKTASAVEGLGGGRRASGPQQTEQGYLGESDPWGSPCPPRFLSDIRGAPMCCGRLKAFWAPSVLHLFPSPTGAHQGSHRDVRGVKPKKGCAQNLGPRWFGEAPGWIRRWMREGPAAGKQRPALRGSPNRKQTQLNYCISPLLTVYPPEN